MIEVVESQIWRHTSGRTASIYGAVPYTSEADRQNWKIEIVGFTWYDTRTNTYGLGRRPAKTREEAQEVADKINRETEERRRILAR